MATKASNKPSCFVMQPFDGGKFDKRFNDVLSPAILDAGLLPYRVDRDPSADILIEDIESGIMSAAACLAEITTDNPNVWYEFGFAVASGVPTCMICSSERTTPFPFDVRHRKIITSEPSSPSDFQKLRKSITERLKLLIAKRRELEGLASMKSSSPTAGLRPHEIALLTVIASNFERNGTSEYLIKRDMDRAGFTELAAAISMQSLLKIGYISWDWDVDEDNTRFKVWNLSQEGTDWLLSNQANLQLRKAKSETGPLIDDSIPF